VGGGKKKTSLLKSFPGKHISGRVGQAKSAPNKLPSHMNNLDEEDTQLTILGKKRGAPYEVVFRPLRGKKQKQLVWGKKLADRVR